MTYTTSTHTFSFLSLFSCQKPKKPPPPSKNIRKERFLPFSSLKSQGIVSCLLSHMHFPVVPLYAFSDNLVYKYFWVGELAAFPPAETAISLQIACFHHTGSGAELSAESRNCDWVFSFFFFFACCLQDIFHLLVGFPVTNSVAETPLSTYTYTHIKSCTVRSYCVHRWFLDLSFSFQWGQAEVLFPCMCKRGVFFSTHTQPHSLPACPSN